MSIDYSSFELEFNIILIMSNQWMSGLSMLIESYDLTGHFTGIYAKIPTMLISKQKDLLPWKLKKA